jgi:molybdopterin-guanine dinucleotide biosynthesis protein A
MPLHSEISGFILAGGASSRLGRNKALVELGGQPMLRRMAGLLDPLVAHVVVIGPPEEYAGLGLRVMPDEEPGLGPLGGLATALRVSDLPWNLIVGCDLPFLTPEWLEHLIGRAFASQAEIVVPVSEAGAEPLCAVYHRRCRDTFRKALDRGVRKVTDAFAGLAVERILPAEWKAFDSEGWLFKNMNTPADYHAARARIERREG